jgi:hypothetical protein
MSRIRGTAGIAPKELWSPAQVKCLCSNIPARALYPDQRKAMPSVCACTSGQHSQRSCAPPEYQSCQTHAVMQHMHSSIVQGARPAASTRSTMARTARCMRCWLRHYSPKPTTVPAQPRVARSTPASSHTYHYRPHIRDTGRPLATSLLKGMQGAHRHTHALCTAAAAPWAAVMLLRQVVATLWGTLRACKTAAVAWGALQPGARHALAAAAGRVRDTHMHAAARACCSRLLLLGQAY